jgi:hypothetical protein
MHLRWWIACLGCVALQAQPYAFEFLRTVVPARAAALGTATVALPGDASLQLLNPALGATLSRASLGSVVLKHVLDIVSGAALYSGIPVLQGSGSVGAVYMDYGRFQRRDALGSAVGEFSAHDLALVLSYADTLERELFYGIAAKALWEQLDAQHALVVALDVGLLYRFPDGRTSIGAALLHVGTALRHFAQEPLPLPTDLRLGLAHALRGMPAVFVFNFARLTEPTASVWQKFENFALGVEFTLSPAMAVRVGYDNKLRRAAPAGARGITGMSAGVGLNAAGVQLDYSATVVTTAVLHRFGVQVGM